MSFEWNKIHKWEDNLEYTIIEQVTEYVCRFYGVDEVTDLTEEQYEEILNFKAHELFEYSVMQIGFSNIIHLWESYNADEEV